MCVCLCVKTKKLSENVYVNGKRRMRVFRFWRSAFAAILCGTYADSDLHAPPAPPPPRRPETSIKTASYILLNTVSVLYYYKKKCILDNIISSYTYILYNIIWYNNNNMCMSTAGERSTSSGDGSTGVVEFPKTCAWVILCP